MSTSHKISPGFLRLRLLLFAIPLLIGGIVTTLRRRLLSLIGLGQVTVQWREGALDEVRVRLSSTVQPQAKGYRVFRLAQGERKLMLSLEPSLVPAKAEFSTAGLPTRIELMLEEAETITLNLS